MLSSKTLPEALFICANLVEAELDNLLPKHFNDSRLVEAMRYSALSKGKRIRPFLLMTIADIFGVDLTKTLRSAAAIEMVHVYSLIHDDLPAMDNDDFRRGLPTNHKKFDEATAILAGDALLTYAFEILAGEETNSDANLRCELVKTLAKASGFIGMAGGQMMDLENANKKISNEELTRLHRLKTGELFMAAAEMGAIIGHANLDERTHLRNFAYDLGLAFQIKDDLLDHYEVNIGKAEIDETVHKKTEDNASIVDVLGIEQAEKQLELIKDQALIHLQKFGAKADLLRQLVDFVVLRNK